MQSEENLAKSLRESLSQSRLSEESHVSQDQDCSESQPSSLTGLGALGECGFGASMVVDFRAKHLGSVMFPVVRGLRVSFPSLFQFTVFTAIISVDFYNIPVIVTAKINWAVIKCQVLGVFRYFYLTDFHVILKRTSGSWYYLNLC